MNWFSRSAKGGLDEAVSRRFSLQNEVSSILASADDLPHVCRTLLPLICETFGWEFGTFWLRNRETGLIESVYVWHREDERLSAFAEVTRNTTFSPGDGLAGRVIETGTPSWIRDLTDDQNYPRARAAGAAGLKSAVGFPVVVKGVAEGSLDFHSRKRMERDRPLLDLMNSIGHQLGQFVAMRRLEVDLTGSETSYRVLVESMSDAVVTIDEESRIRFANTAAERIFGYSRAELVTMNLTDLMPPELREQHKRGFRRYLETGTKHLDWRHVELPALHQDGSAIDVSISFGEAEHGDERRFTGIIRDISDIARIQTEKDQLRERIEAQEERLRKIVSTVPGIVWEAWGAPDQSTQKMNFVSDYVQEMLGYTVEEWLAEENFWLKIVHPEDRERAARSAAESFRTGGGRNSFRWIRRDGEPIWVETQSVTIYEEGQPAGMRGVTMDVTQRIRAQERNEVLVHAGAAMARSLDPSETLEAVARQVVSSVADWCAIDLLEEGKIRRVAVQHVDPQKIELARELERRFPQDPDAETGVPQVLRTGEPQLVTDISEEMLQSVTRGEEHFRLIKDLGLSSYMILPMIARGRVIGAILLVTSESKRRFNKDDLVFGELLARRAALAVDNANLYRAAMLANQAKDEFLATLSHELRTPMTSIMGWSRMLQVERLSEEVRAEAIETIARSAETQSQIIDDVLDVSRIVTGKMKLHLEPVDLNEIIRRALQTVEPAAAAKAITVHTDLQPVPETRADRSRVQQILWNLLSNAIKFTPRKGRIEVKSRSNESLIVIEVEDDGAGMDADFLRHAFERFRQAEGSTTRQHGGLGLGLSIVRHLVELHGGEVHAFSEGRGRGSRFVVELPVAAVQADLETDSAEPADRRSPVAAPDFPDLEGRTVLIVDDEKDARRLISAVLQECGATVHAAGSVAEALRMLDSFAPAVIVSDIGMPEEDGYDLIRRLGELPISPPVIALTAYGREEDRKKIMDAGFVAYLRKPIHPYDLGKAVWDAIQEDGEANPDQA